MLLSPRALGLALSLAVTAPLAQAQTPAPTAPLPAPASVAGPATPAGFDLDTPIAAIVADVNGKAVLDKDLPGLTSHPLFQAFKARSLKELQPMSGGLISDEALARTRTDLASLPPATQQP